MIATQRIKSTTSKPYPYDDYEIVNVLKWNNSRYKSLCPYHLKTDGNEEHTNDGGVIFENYYQGSKVYDAVYSIKVYPSKYHTGKPQYLWWEFNSACEESDMLINANDKINYGLYFRWRNSLWDCPNPIRYPNKINRKNSVQFSLFIDKNGNQERLDYLTARKRIYIQEYIRLVRSLPAYMELLFKLKSGQKLMICEVDVPAFGKRGHYGDCDDEINNISIMNIEKLELLMDDTAEPFGHGLALAYSLLLDAGIN